MTIGNDHVSYLRAKHSLYENKITKAVMKLLYVLISNANGCLNAKLFLFICVRVCVFKCVIVRQRKCKRENVCMGMLLWCFCIFYRD